MLRRLHALQPAAFAFTPANLAWAEAQITKYPAGRQASAIIPLLWRAQEQEGWLSRPAIEHVANMLGMAYIRALEVATFYFMFQLQPVGSVAHIQICGTLSCMITGAEDLLAVCRSKIAKSAHALSADGRFSWEEVECLGACSNAPVTQIGKDYYEDLTPARLEALLDEMAAGKVPVPGPQNGRYAAEPLSGLTTLTEFESGRKQYNASVQAAVDLGETLKRIDGSEVPLRSPWQGKSTPAQAAEPAKAAKPEKPAKPAKAAAPVAAPAATADLPTGEGTKPATLKAPRGGKADDLKLVWGIGPKIEKLLNKLGFFHFDQIIALTAQELVWIDANLEAFKGRASRDRWNVQAQVLLDGGSEQDAEDAMRRDRGEA